STYSDSTAMSNTLNSLVNVVNAGSSPYGAGWSIGGLQQIYPGSSSEPALITAGSQGTERFDPEPAGPINDLTFVHQTVTFDPMLGPTTTYDLRGQSNDGMGDFTAESGTTTVS